MLLFAARLHSPCEPNKLRDRLVRASREGQLAITFNPNESNRRLFSLHLIGPHGI